MIRRAGPRATLPPGLGAVDRRRAQPQAQAARVNLLRRPLQAAHVAQTGVFLAENPAITGVSLSVDNGQHLVPLERDVMFMVKTDA